MPMPQRHRALRHLRVLVIPAALLATTSAQAGLLDGLLGIVGGVVGGVVNTLTTTLQGVDYNTLGTAQATAAHSPTCRAQEARLGIQRASYGSQTATGRRALNDCTPQLLFTRPLDPAP